MPGYAEDKGDKAVYKAITGATKYAFWKCFGLSTGDDPETEDEGAKSRTDLPDSKRASPLHHVKSYPAINQLQPHEQIMAVMNRIGIDPKQQPIIGKKALFACYPGTKSQDLTPVQTFEVIRILLLQYGNEAGVFKAHDHCLAAFNKVIREQHLEGADALSVTSAWLEDLQQRTQERLRAEQSENA